MSLSQTWFGPVAAPVKSWGDAALLVDAGEEVVADGWAGLTGFAPPPVVRREHAGGRAQTPHPVLGRDDAGIDKLVSDEPVAQGGIFFVDAEDGVDDMDAEDGVDDMGVVPAPLGDRIF